MYEGRAWVGTKPLCSPAAGQSSPLVLFLMNKPQESYRRKGGKEKY